MTFLGFWINVLTILTLPSVSGVGKKVSFFVDVSIPISTFLIS